MYISLSLSPSLIVISVNNFSLLFPFSLRSHRILQQSVGVWFIAVRLLQLQLLTS